MTRHSFFRSLLWTVAIIAGALAGNQALAKPITSVKPLRTLGRDDAVAASKAGDRGDLMRAETDGSLREFKTTCTSKATSTVGSVAGVDFARR